MRKNDLFLGLLVLLLICNHVTAQSCTPGNYWTGSACTYCRVGTYSTTYGATSCTPCPYGTYMNVAAFPGTSSSVCLPCPVGSSTFYEGQYDISFCLKYLCPKDHYCLSGIAYPCPEGMSAPVNSYSFLGCRYASDESTLNNIFLGLGLLSLAVILVFTFCKTFFMAASHPIQGNHCLSDVIQRIRDSPTIVQIRESLAVRLPSLQKYKTFLMLVLMYVDFGSDIAGYMAIKTQFRCIAPGSAIEIIYSGIPRYFDHVERSRPDLWFSFLADHISCSMQCVIDSYYGSSCTLSNADYQITQDVLGTATTIFIILIVKESLKAVLFLIFLMNDSLRSSPNIQYFSLNVLSVPVAAIFGKEVLTKYVLSESNDTAKMTVLDILFEDGPQAFLAIYVLKTLNRPGAPITVFSLFMSVLMLTLSIIRLFYKLMEVGKETKLKIQVVASDAIEPAAINVLPSSSSPSSPSSASAGSQYEQEGTGLDVRVSNLENSFQRLSTSVDDQMLELRNAVSLIEAALNIQKQHKQS